MGMQFTVTLTGTASVEVEASDLGLDLNDPHEFFDASSSIEFDNVELSGSVNLTADVRVENVEVSASDLGSYDADTALQEYAGPYGGINIENADFEITDEPTGFDVVTEAVGYDREQAIAVYAALDAAGHEVI